MALNILRQPSLGGQIGEAFGTGLGSSLQNLAKLKFNQLQQGQQEARLQQAGLPGVLAYLDPQVQASYLKEYGAQQQRSQQEVAQNLAEPYLQQALKQAYGIPEEAPLQQLDQAQQLTPEQQQQGLQALQQLEQSIPGEGFRGQDIQSQLMDQTLQAPGISQLLDSIAPKPLGQPQVPQQELPYISQKEVSKAVPLIKPTSEFKLKKEIDILRDQLLDPSVDSRAKGKIAERMEKKQEIFTKRSDRLFDKHGNFIQEVTKKARDADEMLTVVKRQQVLNEKGDLTSPGTLKFYEKLGLDIDALKTGDTQEFIKNNGIFMKNLKNLFGGRITDNEIRLYMKTLGNEHQSPEGRRRILASQEKLLKSELARVEAMDKILEANSGMPTELLPRDIEKVVRKDIDKLQKEFSAELRKKPLPVAESTASILAKQAAATGINIIPTLVKGALGIKGIGALKGLLGK